MITTMTIKQAAPLIQAVLANLDGGDVRPINNASDYMSEATRVNNHDADQVMGAISQMWGRTIFAIRPYTSMLRDMVYDTDAWSLAERKINYVSRLPSDNAAWDYPVTRDDTKTDNPLGDGLAVDMYRINKDKVYETAFYGASTWSTSRTTFRNQLRPAFRDPEELVRYNAAAVQQVQNDRETWAEAYIRGILVGTIERAMSAEEHNVHLVTEYCAITGDEPADVMTDGQIYGDFVRWMYGRVATIKRNMAERNAMYTTQPTDLPAGLGILRHTPNDRLKMLFSAQRLDDMRSRVLSATYNPDLLDIGTITPVNYWVNPNNPEYAVAGEPPVIGVMFDRDALGVMPVDNRVFTTPFNADGEYYNTFFKTLWKNRVDLSEKFVVLCLD